MTAPSSSSSRNLVLVGFMGSGKSSVGRLLATRLGFHFVDTDALVVQNAGKPISDIFAKEGEEAFRQMETDALRSLLHQPRLVIATGGGIVTQERNHPLLREAGLVIGLTAEEDVIFERVSRNTRRPLLQTLHPRQTIADLLAVRRPLYRAVAEREIDTSAKTHAEVAEEIASLLSEIS